MLENILLQYSLFSVHVKKKMIYCTVQMQFIEKYCKVTGYLKPGAIGRIVFIKYERK
jgi:hypothetical protein